MSFGVVFFYHGTNACFPMHACLFVCLFSSSFRNEKREKIKTNQLVSKNERDGR
jgi:hypothetical protein